MGALIVSALTGCNKHATTTSEQTAQESPSVTINAAHTWYEAEYCDSLLGSCNLQTCELSDKTPASIYENNRGYDDDQILDSGTGRVDAIAQGGRFIFFSTATACKKFVAEQTAAANAQEQAQQKALDNYH
jgi:hypothetical protein